MENNELRLPEKKGPPRWLTILLLVIGTVSIVVVSMVFMGASQFTKILKEMEIGQGLPLVTIVFVQYWYLWIILLLLLLVISILTEIFVRGKRRWINVILSSFTVILCIFLFCAFFLAVLEPLTVLMKQLSG